MIKTMENTDIVNVLFDNLDRSDATENYVKEKATKILKRLKNEHIHTFNVTITKRHERGRQEYTTRINVSTDDKQYHINVTEDTIKKSVNSAINKIKEQVGRKKSKFKIL